MTKNLNLVNEINKFDLSNAFPTLKDKIKNFDKSKILRCHDEPCRTIMCPSKLHYLNILLHSRAVLVYYSKMYTFHWQEVSLKNRNLKGFIPFAPRFSLLFFQVGTSSQESPSCEEF